ncbi:MAG TPA: endonuclease/exonuclease/phosphatase family protein [Thermodesulfobacteriota bacterium]|nr:endonuclease/exonuclease/phosphatase family protein [Thermodesulfobacteriota bacterium]
MKSSTRKVLGTKFIGSLVLLIALLASLSAVHAADSLNGSITVMTRNLYVGAAFDSLLSVPTPNDIPGRVAQIYAEILSSQYPCRAEAIADEIVQNQPDLVGLQEAVLLRVYSPCGTSVPNPSQPMTFAVDYLQILLDALERRGAHYAVAASIANTDVTAISATGDTIRLTDRDVILARSDLSTNELRVSKPRAENFKARFTVEVGGTGGPSLTVLRGWCSVDVRVRGKSVRVISTHLEEDSVPFIQFAQANELLAGPLRTFLPVIALGDFNASVGSTTYGNIIGSGFQDAWTVAHPSDPGFSCCQAADLLNPTSQLSTRIDLILFRGRRVGVDDMQLVGANSNDRLSTGQWPSDHAGVVGTLSIR